MLIFWKRCTSLLRRNHQILLKFAVRHGVGGYMQMLRGAGKRHGEDVKCHAAPQLLSHRMETGRHPQRLEAGGKIIQRLLAEIGAAVFRKELPVDLPLLQSLKYL